MLSLCDSEGGMYNLSLTHLKTNKSHSHVTESHMEKERRGEAMFVLDNPEALMAHAQANSDVSCLSYKKPSPEVC